MRIAIVTANFGGYDPLSPAPNGFDDAVVVTDSEEHAADGWRVHLEPTPNDPRLAGKIPKMNPWRYTDCDAAVFMDASIEVTYDRLREWVEPLLAVHDLIVWSHPEGRTCLRQEAEVCQDWPKYAPYDIRGQVNHYDTEGMPHGWGLFACGLIGWRFTDEAKRFGDLWLNEQYAWSIQDQVALPYLLWASGKPFGIWPAHQYQNPFFRIRWDRRPAGQGPSAPQ
jgi:hypothetical protein